jgi:anti-anti-sigma regulatory factor
MRICASENLVVERAGYGVRVLRFTRPDLRKFLYEEAEIEDSPLFRELREMAIDDLPRGWTLVINLGLVEWFPAALYRCLLQCRQLLLARPAQLVLCGLNDEHLELFRILQGHRVFTIAATEAAAFRNAALNAAASVTPSSHSQPRRRLTDRIRSSRSRIDFWK